MNLTQLNQNGIAAAMLLLSMVALLCVRFGHMAFRAVRGLRDALNRSKLSGRTS